MDATGANALFESIGIQFMSSLVGMLGSQEVQLGQAL